LKKKKEPLQVVDSLVGGDVVAEIGNVLHDLCLLGLVGVLFEEIGGRGRVDGPRGLKIPRRNLEKV